MSFEGFGGCFLLFLLFLESCHPFGVYVKYIVAGFCYKFITLSGFFGEANCCFVMLGYYFVIYFGFCGAMGLMH